MTPPTTAVEATAGVYDVLRDRILHAHYAPGQLLREAPVADDLGVSRTPVREALIRLSENGLLERTTRGLRVRERSVSELGEVYEACILVEPAVARLAALRRRPQHLVALDDVLDSTRRALDAGADDPHVLMDQWHIAVWQAADNDTLAHLLESLSAQLFSIPAPVLGITEWGVSLESHREMTEAIRRQDADAAEELMRVHLEAGRDAALRSLSTLPTTPRT
jgi:DNA-binding GntR family transcriptional regulator